MIRVQTFPCPLTKAEADARNRESGRHSTNVLVWHDRIDRRSGPWLCGHWLCRPWLWAYAAHRWEDYLGGPTILPAHRRDAVHAGCSAACSAACKGAMSQQRMGLDRRTARSAHRRHGYRTTTGTLSGTLTGTLTGIRLREGVLLLARSRGLEPIRVTLPDPLRTDPARAFKQAELGWDRAGRRDTWHVTRRVGTAPAPTPARAVGAVTLLSRKVPGEWAKRVPPPVHATTYRHPAGVSGQGKRSPLDTGQVARSVARTSGREAAAL